MNKRPVYRNETEGIAWTTTPQGDKVTVSIADVDLIEERSVFRWASNTGGDYPAMRVKGKNKRLHKAVQTRIGFSGVCDHINRNPFDNRRENLRPASHSMNNQNVSIRKDNSSGYLGVYYRKDAKKFSAQIYRKVNGKSKRKHLGHFSDSRSAAIAYDAAALEYHGPHSTTNESLGLLDET